MARMEVGRIYVAGVVDRRCGVCAALFTQTVQLFVGDHRNPPWPSSGLVGAIPAPLSGCVGQVY
jgi:hypothetical protein